MVWILALGVLAMLLVPTVAYGFINGKAVELELASIGDGYRLRSDAARAFLAMRAEAARDGIALRVNSAFRTMAEQQALFAKWQTNTGSLAARPGYSNHQSGIAVDIDTDGTATNIYLWLAANASRWSFKRTVPSEPWHWEFRP